MVVFWIIFKIWSSRFDAPTAPYIVRFLEFKNNDNSIICYPFIDFLNTTPSIVVYVLYRKSNLTMTDVKTFCVKIVFISGGFERF